MSRSTEQIQFVEVDEEAITSALISKYESLSGRTVRPASPERLFIGWVTYFVMFLLNQINYVGNQNLPSRASGENLDTLGADLFHLTRPTATAAVTTLRFTISAAQSSAIVIPAGTRVSAINGSPVFATDEDAVIPAGSTTVDVSATCQTVGTSYNGYGVGQINKCMDLFAYFASVTNTTVTDGGTNDASDDEYYDLMIASLDAYSTAGSRAAYKYHAKSVGNIQDVIVNSPQPAYVDIYALMTDGTIASTTVKNLILAACSAEDVRPLTDYVRVRDPEVVTYNINMTYYLSNDSSESASTLISRIEAAVDEYVTWQCSKIGLDINPQKLIELVKRAGAKRVVLTAPERTVLKNGLEKENDQEAVASDFVPQVARLGTRTLTNGGYEDE